MKRNLSWLLLGALLLGAPFPMALAQQAMPEVTMHKDPTCGCCGEWGTYLRSNGFKVKVIENRNMDGVKRRLGVPEDLASCHTAEVGGYIIEGHLPASSIRRLLKERPAILGLSAPGMPQSAPGMNIPGNKDPYDVIAFDKMGKTSVYEHIR